MESQRRVRPHGGSVHVADGDVVSRDHVRAAGGDGEVVVHQVGAPEGEDIPRVAERGPPLHERLLELTYGGVAVQGDFLHRLSVLHLQGDGRHGPVSLRSFVWSSFLKVSGVVVVVDDALASWKTEEH